MTDLPKSATISINGYSDSATGHVSISVAGQTYEQQWRQSPTPLLGLLSLTIFNGGTVGFRDGVIQVRPADASPPSVEAEIEVAADQESAILAFVEGSLGPNAYGLFSTNCVEFVNNALAAGNVGIDTYDALASAGGIPGAKLVEISIAIKTDSNALFSNLSNTPALQELVFRV